MLKFIFFTFIFAAITSCSSVKEDNKINNIEYLKKLELDCETDKSLCLLAGFIHKDKNRLVSSYKYFQKACSSGLQEACPYMDEVNLNIKGFTKDIGNAEEICKNSQPVCIRLGAAYYYLEQFKNAEKILLDGCKAGQKLGCYLLAQHFEYVQQSTRAIFFYNKACQLKYDWACELETTLRKRKQ